MTNLNKTLVLALILLQKYVSSTPQSRLENQSYGEREDFDETINDVDFGDDLWKYNLDDATGLYLLTYSFSSEDHATNLKFKTFRKGVLQAMCSWERVSNIVFMNIGIGQWSADILIGFEKGEHGDGHAFDGVGGKVAHAFLPVDGRIHFDADEKWYFASKNKEQPSKIDVFSTALHELGHTLGLVDSDDNSSLMVRKYKFRGIFENFHMPPKELSWVRETYGNFVKDSSSKNIFGACQELEKHQGPVCEDNSVFATTCKRWEKGGYCKFLHVKKKCKMTCGLCT